MSKHLKNLEYVKGRIGGVDVIVSTDRYLNPDIDTDLPTISGFDINNVPLRVYEVVKKNDDPDGYYIYAEASAKRAPSNMLLGTIVSKEPLRMVDKAHVGEIHVSMLSLSQEPISLKEFIQDSPSYDHRKLVLSIDSKNAYEAKLYLKQALDNLSHYGSEEYVNMRIYANAPDLD